MKTSHESIKWVRLHLLILIRDFRFSWLEKVCTGRVSYITNWGIRFCLVGRNSNEVGNATITLNRTYSPTENYRDQLEKLWRA
jgi:hypothetical protein